jgi:hypothetical protein
VTALELEEVTPDASIADLEKRWGISRNALKARAKALGIELQRKGPTLTVWPGDRIHDGDRFNEHLKSRAAMASFPGVVAVTPHGGSDAAQLAVTPHGGGGDQLAVLAAAISAAMPAPAVDPLARARGLAEVADAALVLTNGDLESLLGQGISSWKEGHLAYGYQFHRHQQGRQVLWTVSRAVTATPDSRQLASSKRVGFLAEPPVAARHAITVQAISLPFV